MFVVDQVPKQKPKVARVLQDCVPFDRAVVEPSFPAGHGKDGKGPGSGGQFSSPQLTEFNGVQLNSLEPTSVQPPARRKALWFCWV